MQTSATTKKTNPPGSPESQKRNARAEVSKGWTALRNIGLSKIKAKANNSKRVTTNNAKDLQNHPEDEAPRFIDISRAAMEDYNKSKHVKDACRRLSHVASYRSINLLSQTQFKSTWTVERNGTASTPDLLGNWDSHTQLSPTDDSADIDAYDSDDSTHGNHFIYDEPLGLFLSRFPDPPDGVVVVKQAKKPVGNTPKGGNNENDQNVLPASPSGADLTFKSSNSKDGLKPMRTVPSDPLAENTKNNLHAEQVTTNAQPANCTPATERLDHTTKLAEHRTPFPRQTHIVPIPDYNIKGGCTKPSDVNPLPVPPKDVRYRRRSLTASSRRTPALGENSSPRRVLRIRLSAEFLTGSLQTTGNHIKRDEDASSLKRSTSEKVKGKGKATGLVKSIVNNGNKVFSKKKNKTRARSRSFGSASVLSFTSFVDVSLEEPEIAASTLMPPMKDTIRLRH